MGRQRIFCRRTRFEQENAVRVGRLTLLVNRHYLAPDAWASTRRPRRTHEVRPVELRRDSTALDLLLDPQHNLKCGEGEQGEMRKVLIGSFMLAACVVCASRPAVAQVRQRVPHAQSIAAGLDGAAFVPSSNQGDQLDSAPMV